MTTHKIGYFVGSLATGSINRTLSKALIKLAPDELHFTEIPIKELPLYNYDYDPDYPPEGRAWKEAIEASDGILFISPEYNRSIPGPLKTPSTGDHGRGGRTPSLANRPESSAPPREVSAQP